MIAAPPPGGVRRLASGPSAAKLGDYELVLELSSRETTVLLARKTGPKSFARWASIRYVGPFVGPLAERLEQIDRDLKRASFVRHPCVLPIHESGFLGNGRYVVSDYIEGATLAELCEGGPLPSDLVVAIARDVLGGLHAVHVAEDNRGRGLGLLHGRISPACVVVGLDGRARLAELGLAAVPRAREAASRTETYHYEAPEVLAGGAPTVRSDVYSLGMVLYEALLGEHPLSHARDVASLQAALRTPVPLLSVRAPSVAPDLAGVVARAMALEPEARWASVEELAGALERASPPASARDVGAFVGLRAGDRVERRRALSSEWVADHDAGRREEPSRWLRWRWQLAAYLRRRPTLATVLLVLLLIATGVGVGALAVGLR